MPRSPRQLVGVLLVLLAAGLAAAVAWQGMHADTRDYASFHFAVEVWQAGGDPYDNAALDAAAAAEGTRRRVYPFFYPPPALALLAWTAHLGLARGYAAMFWFNQAALLGVLAVLRRWFSPPLGLLALLALTWTPVGWSGQLGQVNVLLCLPVVAALWRTSGSLLALPALVKISPAVLAGPWLARGWWRPLAAAVLAVLLAHLVLLPWVPLELQRHYYADVLPQFASGAYNSLKVPISLPANHSVANLLDQLWPGTRHTLSPEAAWATRGLVGAALLGLLALARSPRDALGEATLAGAFLVLMVLSPVFAYEHHLVFLLPAMAAAATAWLRGRLPRWSLVLVALSWLFLVLPIEHFRALQQAWPDLAWWVRESKMAGALLLAGLCVAATLRSPASSGPRPAPSPAS